jgi:PAS domain S-box-containing protein
MMFFKRSFVQASQVISDLSSMSWLHSITSSGTEYAATKLEKRNITLTNYISLITAFACVSMIIGRSMFATFHWDLAANQLFGVALLLLPILLNRMGFTIASRIAVCWLPTLYQLYATVEGLHYASVFESSSYVGLRFLMLSFSFFPFLVFNLKDRLLLLLAIAVPVSVILFYDPLLTVFGVGYDTSGLREPTYYFNNVRIFIAFMILAAGAYFLKMLIDRNERINESLIAELATKNEVIKKQAADEVYQLNQQLLLNLEQLTEREFILNQSQRIAKVGSWDYDLKSRLLFWSDEMYNMFGLDTSFDLSAENLYQRLWAGEGTLLDNANKDLLSTGKAYDLTVRTTTPLGYQKWLRVYGYPIVENNEIVGARGICHDVTFYKEAEERIRVSEKKYYSLFEQASDAILVTDFKGNLTDANASLCKMFGYRKEELVRLNISALVIPEDLAETPIRFDLLSEGEHVFSNRSMVHKNGTRVEVEANVKRFDENAIMAIVRDVTELRRAQRQVEISEARFRSAFEFSGVGMALVSLDGKWLKVNKELCVITGYPEEELLTLSFQQITYPEDLYNDLKFLQQAREGLIETYRVEKRYVHKNGSLIWVNLNVSLIKENQTKPLYFVSQIENITDKKIAQEELMLSQANLNATINNTEILIWSVDREFRLITFNKPFSEYIKETYGLDVQVGRRIFAAQNSAQATDLTKTWQDRYLRALSGEIVVLEETRFGRDLKYSLSPIIENRKVVGVSVFADNITERKARDRALLEAQQKIGELKLMALRSVMNPHFVFNVLNSIQFFITKNDKLNAINYLSMFSKLVRGVLTHSVSNKIRLSDELEMLTNYIQLEMTRFENKFDFVLEVDPEVDQEGIEIPSLLIQPYVENAILHGLYNKTGTGTLTVRVAEQDSTLIFEIEDNGIGRAAAIKLREKNFPAHKSMGIKLTEERLRLINEQHNVSFAIEDLHDSSGPSGTRVRIGINIA